MSQLSQQSVSVTPNAPLPAIVAGPILRRATPQSLTFWMVTTSNSALYFTLQDEQGQHCFECCLDKSQLKRVQIGEQAFINLITIDFKQPLKQNQRYYYDLLIGDIKEQATPLKQAIPDLVYPGEVSPSFVIKTQLSNILHGSCRKPHHESHDGLVEVDALLANALTEPEQQPDMLIMTGDQVYADDVAGPTLVAIHQVIDLLGLFHESIPFDGLNSSEQLLTHENCYYQRPLILPDDIASDTLLSVFFKGKKKPIFTSVNANNHLVSFAEIMAMYCLTWSPQLWQRVVISDKSIAENFKPKFAAEKSIIEDFVHGLSKVQRALAHIPVYMIFDDHDITDDWNLTRGWEEAVYNHPLAKRIVGNALIGYWLCQGWGNASDKFTILDNKIDDYFTPNGIEKHEQLIDDLLDWDEWHYELPTHPKVVVLDTRTQRWRSESSLSKPSGLMDWEALCEAQQALIGQPSVILVSAAPIFGVKFIETVQRVFTFFGKALVVDAENWMAHKGTASVILNIFRHIKTPPNFVILSGDVHYSFVYDITLKFRRNSPKITQITCSGIKNTFPNTLLGWLDKLNRILYAPNSPLNWFTKRRNMTITHRKPGSQKVRTLYNGSGIGQVKLDEKCEHVETFILQENGHVVRFNERV